MIDHAARERVQTAVIRAAGVIAGPHSALRYVWREAQAHGDREALAELMRDGGDGGAWVDLAARVQLARAIDSWRAA